MINQQENIILKADTEQLRCKLTKDNVQRPSRKAQEEKVLETNSVVKSDPQQC